MINYVEWKIFFKLVIWLIKIFEKDNSINMNYNIFSFKTLDDV